MLFQHKIVNKNTTQTTNCFCFHHISYFPGIVAVSSWIVKSPVRVNTAPGMIVSIAPDLIRRFLQPVVIPDTTGKFGLAGDMMTFWSDAGTALGVQFDGLLHCAETEPFQMMAWSLIVMLSMYKLFPKALIPRKINLVTPGLTA